jgi:hypothetical protein
MLKTNRIIIWGVLLSAGIAASWAQNNTNSPYTRFGYGELANRSIAAGRAMGGIGVGLRSSRQINPLNPASYTAMDSLTFIFDFGVHAQMSWYNDGTHKQRNTNGNVEYMTMQFPIIPQRLAMSMGILPYSHVGYRFGEQKTEDGLTYAENFIGTGGINEVYGGLSVDVWKKRLAIGANAGYLFGSIDHQKNVIFDTNAANNNVNTQRIEVRDIKWDLGLQYTHPLSAAKRVTFGATYSPAKRLHTTSYNSLQVGSGASGYSVSDTTFNQRFDLPGSYGFGLSFVKDNQLTVGADVLYEGWSKAHYFDEEGFFKDRMRFAAGVEYIVNYMGRNYFQRVKYRVGGYYGNSYLNMNMTEGGVQRRYGYAEYGATLGFGFPLRTGYTADDNRSYINVSLEYVKVKPELRTMIDEQYLRFTLNFTFNEMWFYKLKMQ